MKQENNKVLQPKQRQLGWELFRVFGTLMVVIGHTQTFILSYDWFGLSDRPVLTHTDYIINQLFSPMAVNALFYLCVVPMFIVLSGYFCLNKPILDGASEWKNALKKAWKYYAYVMRWTILGVGCAFLYQTFTGAELGWLAPFKGMGGEQIFFEIVERVCGGVGHQENWFGVLYFVIGLAGLMLYSPMLKPLFSNPKNVNIARFSTLVVCIGCFGVNAIRTFGTKWLAVYPESAFFNFCADFIQHLHGWDFISTFWVPFFMIGGLLALDEELRNKIKNISWSKLAVIYVVAIAWEMIFRKLKFDALYENFPSWPLFLVLLTLIFKFNDIIKPESKFGKFLTTYSPDMLGAMTVFYPINLLTIKDFPIYDIMALFWEKDNIFAGIMTNVWIFATHIVAFGIVVLIVHQLRKIPVVKRMFEL